MFQDRGIIVRQEREYSSTVSNGYIIDYAPMTGTLLQEGDEVTIVISQGPEEEPPVTVTNFVGLPIDQVRDQVTGLGLTIGTVSPFHNDEYPENVVIWQSLSVGDEVTPGTVINFQVSMGSAPEPSVEPTPGASDPIPGATQDVNAPAGTSTIHVDLSPYEGTVEVRIEVGGREIYDNRVNASDVGFLSQPVTGTGTQTVSVYIDGQLMQRYSLTFGA